MLKKEAGYGNVLDISQIKPVLKWHIRLPKRYQSNIIKEMIELGLLKRLGRDNFEILPLRRRCNPPINSIGEPLWN